MYILRFIFCSRKIDDSDQLISSTKHPIKFVLYRHMTANTHRFGRIKMLIKVRNEYARGATSKSHSKPSLFCACASFDRKAMQKIARANGIKERKLWQKRYKLREFQFHSTLTTKIKIFLIIFLPFYLLYCYYGYRLPHIHINMVHNNKLRTLQQF